MTPSPLAQQIVQTIHLADQHPLFDFKKSLHIMVCCLAIEHSILRAKLDHAGRKCFPKHTINLCVCDSGKIRFKLSEKKNIYNEI